MTDLSGASREFADLAKNLRLVGADELRAELYKAVSDAAKPISQEIRSGLDAYMPNPYAAVLAADLSLTTTKRTGTDPGVQIRARGRVKQRKVQRLDAGSLWHPVWARGPRSAWHWAYQTSHVRAGFFTNPAERSAPQVRDQILSAMHRIAEKAVGR